VHHLVSCDIRITRDRPCLPRNENTYGRLNNRKNALFAGSDGGAEHWAIIASLIETCKLAEVDPRAYLSEIITKIVNGHPNSRLDELLPWAYHAANPLRNVA
jgi:transposase